MLRTCISCRRRAAPASLLRLQLGTQNQLHVVTVKNQHQRSVWVCCDLPCIEKLKKKKNALKRIYPSYLPSISNLMEQIESQTLQQIKRLIQLCFRSGFVVSGPQKVTKEIDQLALLFVTNNPIQRRWKNLFSHKPIYSLQISSQELGNWLNRGPRQVIGLLPNRHIRSANQYLHLLGQLR